MHDISMDSSDSDRTPNLAIRNSTHSSLADNMFKARIGDQTGMRNNS